MDLGGGSNEGFHFRTRVWYMKMTARQGNIGRDGKDPA